MSHNQKWRLEKQGNDKMFILTTAMPRSLGTVIHSWPPAPPPTDHPTFSFASSILYTHHSSVFPVSTFLRSLHTLLSKVTFCCPSNLRDWTPGVNLPSGSAPATPFWTVAFPPSSLSTSSWQLSFWEQLFSAEHQQVALVSGWVREAQNSSLQHWSLKSILYNYT